MKQGMPWRLPLSAYFWLRANYHWLRAVLGGQEYIPPFGGVNFGNLDRIKPINANWGFERGSPVDRYYIDQFLSAHLKDICGRVLEIEDNTYTLKFGGDRVQQSDILHVKAGNPQATIVADLTCADQIANDTFDCILLTQTLQLIYDVHAVVKTLYRILKPGGVVLATFPGITQISHYSPETETAGWTPDTDNWSDSWYWNFTQLSACRLFTEAFPSEAVDVQTYGNVFAAIAMLHGLAAEELQQEKLEQHDCDYQVLITVRAQKPAHAS
jgi:SAM-dependent methyltransferase